MFSLVDCGSCSQQCAAVAVRRWCGPETDWMRSPALSARNALVAEFTVKQPLVPWPAPEHGVRRAWIYLSHSHVACEIPRKIGEGDRFRGAEEWYHRNWNNPGR